MILNQIVLYNLFFKKPKAALPKPVAKEKPSVKKGMLVLSQGKKKPVDKEEKKKRDQQRRAQVPYKHTNLKDFKTFFKDSNKIMITIFFLF